MQFLYPAAYVSDNEWLLFPALASAMMLGPRLGRYDMGNEPLPLGSPVNAVMGLFVLWWGWLAFNSGR